MSAGTDPKPEPRHRRPLDAFFAPRSVAVIGATERPGSIGRVLMENLRSAPAGLTLYPVNPHSTEILGLKAYPDVAAIPGRVDLAVIATPAATVPGVIGQCAAAGVRGAVIISAGFKESGVAGDELEHDIVKQARQSRLRIIGPNCLGVMRPLAGLNATFAGVSPAPGRIAFLSQSGALGTAILDWSVREQVGISAFVSVGSMLDVGWGDLIDYFADDPHTGSILIYMESIGDTRSFLSAAREAALTKPIIVIKPGRSPEGAKAAASHTGSLVGRDEVLDAAFRRIGVLRVESIESLFDMAEVLAKQPRPRGPRLMVLTNAGGPGVLATDALIRGGGRLAELTPDTRAALDKVLPAAWSHSNPVDLLGDADADRYGNALDAVAQHPDCDGLLVILTPQAMTAPTATAQRVAAMNKGHGRPIIASWMGGGAVAEGNDVLNRAGVPTYAYPDRAASVFCDMWRYTHNLRLLYETPQLPDDAQWGSPDRAHVETVIAAARAAGRTLLTEAESKAVLNAYHLPVVPVHVAATVMEALWAAGTVGYPVVLKVHSTTITHKRRVGGVRLNLRDAAAVREAFESIRASITQHAGAEHFHGVTVQPMVADPGCEVVLGSSIDPQFGPVLLFGAGGAMVEVMRDYALGLPPLNTTLARRMMERTRVFNALSGAGGQEPVNLARLDELLVRFSQLVVEQRWIKEIDINPLWVGRDRMIAMDARVVLHDAATPEQDLPRAAIRPYPVRYAEPWRLRDGTPITIRPIRPEDEKLLVRFHETLSPESVYYRYFNVFKLSERIAHDRLSRICFIDYDRAMVLVAERDAPAGGKQIIGVARLTKHHDAGEGEWASLISDEYQRQGLGTELIRRLIRFARDEKMTRLVADILPQNIAMQRVATKLGMRLRFDSSEGTTRAELDL
ncbi:MAG: bifunctional acetate--CoA ligase family protein/GNAT family N-acetyltransferase [Planctomycetes bacterium]|nr:bifunctional acetate--CoA ligase family protein/GNAT family N-acetyltransferase [Planctomycetota bacterium]